MRVGLTLALLLSTTAAWAGPDLAGMRQVGGDEFDAPVFDPSKWLLGVEPNGNQWGSSAYFVTAKPGDATLVPKVYIQGDGNLTIRANYNADFKDPVAWNQKWFSGLIIPKGRDGRVESAAFRQGCAEIRAKLPLGAGTWPGFWALNLASMGPNGDPLGNQELDGLEHYGHRPMAFNSGLIDWANKDTRTNHVGAAVTLAADPTAAFTTYDFCLTATSMVTWVDGVQKATLPLYRPDTMGKVFWMFNLAMGSGWPITVPPSGSYDLQIDYVRIFSAD